MTCLYCYGCRMQLDLPTDGKLVSGKCERCRCPGLMILDDSQPPKDDR